MTAVDFPGSRSTGRPFPWPYVASCAVGFAVSIQVTVGWHVHLVPDVSLYLVTGFGIYPSLGGTALGELGYLAFALVNGLAVGFICALVLSSRPSKLALIFAAPVLLWLLPLGVDSIAAFLLLVCLMRWSGAGFAAIGFHYAMLPVVGAVWLVRSRHGLELAALCGVLAAVLAVATPYGGSFPFAAAAVRGLPAFAVVMALALAPLLVVPLDREAGAPLAGVAIGTAVVVFYATASHVASGVPFGLSVFAASRYALPLVLVLLVSGEGDRSGLRRLRATEGT